MAKETDDKQCEKCDAHCCKYIGVPLDKPDTWGEFDDYIWFLHHKGTFIYVEDGDWYLQVSLPCRNLTGDLRCKVYEKRPRICRKHPLADCEFDGKPYDFSITFQTPEELEKYGRAFLREKYRRRKRRKK